jgi:hypothetical protein
MTRDDVPDMIFGGRPAKPWGRPCKAVDRPEESPPKPFPSMGPMLGTDGGPEHK